MTREEALERLIDYFEYEDGLSADKDTQEAYKIAVEALKTEPVKHGRWEWEKVVLAYTCSLCHHYTYDGQPNYCPACGAKMDL